MQSMQSSTASRIRWYILSLIFLATTINYLDRIMFGFLMPKIRESMAVDDVMYGRLTAAFELAYTIGFLAMGKFIDRYGTKLGYAVATLWWSLASIFHAFARVPMDLGIGRFLLGLGEAGNFPAAIKGVAEWFPKKDRAFATGIFNAGTNVASMVGPPVFAAMIFYVDWRACFWITGCLGFVWLVLWWLLYKSPEMHPGVNAEELAYIKSDAEDTSAKMGWLEVFKYRQTWGFALGKLLSDPVWRFYSYWLPLYLYDVRKFDMKQVGWVLPLIYLMADIGSVGGGWLSGYFIRKGWPVGKSRKMTMGICAAFMPIAVTAVLVENPIIAIGLMSLATAAHQGWSANLYTTASDVFPKKAVASVIGIGGAAGGAGSFLLATLIPGMVIQKFGYTPVFLTYGVFHLTALLLVHLFMKDLDPIQEG